MNSAVDTTRRLVRVVVEEGHVPSHNHPIEKKRDDFLDHLAYLQSILDGMMSRTEAMARSDQGLLRSHITMMETQIDSAMRRIGK